MYRRSVNLDSILKTDIVSEVEANKILELQKQIKKIRLDKNDNIFKKFMNEKTVYNYDKHIILSDLRKEFKKYAYNLNKENLDNIIYNCKDVDILGFNPKFKIKSFSYCRGCQTRYRMGCCDENNRMNRSSKALVLHIDWK